MAAPKKAKTRKLKNRSNRAWLAAERMGIDISLIEINLSLSVQERIRAHDRALNLALELREAMEHARGRS